jgi:uncharacterized protein (TIGR00369 family)
MNPDQAGSEYVREISYRANFIRDLDIRLDKVSEGTCETSLVVQERLLQQHGFIHGGVIATMADHTAGGAARSVSGDKDVLTVEFKINYLRPAIGDRVALHGFSAARRQDCNCGGSFGVCQQCRKRNVGGQADGNAVSG